ncbi:SDR family oxidoreductase [Chryseobacterium arthrosphaerae]|uniref:SDR family oxidoreductase n=1 Tax=Chryseobacterium arthrosphaerae TaxID=651561 RepID=UPI003D34BC89
MSKILITGATGHLGKETIKFLLNKGIPADQISALVRDENKATDLKEKGINLIVGDYENYASLVTAFKDIDKLFFVSSSDVPNRTPQHKNVVEAAKEASVKHVVYTSALSNVPIDKSIIAFVAEAHIKTEQWLEESGLSHTLLRNNLYMDLVPQFISDKVLETGSIFLPAGNGKTAFVTRAEMAEAAAVVLTTEGHVGKTYNITNLQAYTYQDVADNLTEITGKKISYVSPTAEEFTKALKNAGVPEEMIGGFTAFALAQAKDEFNVTGDDLVGLLGRKPTTLKDFLTIIYGKK